MNLTFLLFRRTETKVTSTSAENMECLGDVVGRLQESGEAARLLTCTSVLSIVRIFMFGRGVGVGGGT